MMLVAVLITTTTISGTFAKYTTNGISTDEARVAKFCVTVAATGAEDIFAAAYDNEAVLSTADVVAPGTTGTLGGFTVTDNTAEREVAVEVLYTSDITLSGWELTTGAKDYCPLIFTVDSVDYYIGKDGVATQDDLVAKVKAVLEAKSDVYEVGSAIADTLAFSWRWDFEGETGANGQSDLKDTVLGQAGTATVEVAITCTINQVNDLP